MSTVIFETGKAIFHFHLQDVFASLQDHSSCDQDATDLVNILESSSSETRRIPSEKGFFGYIVVDLLGKDKGFVFCKDCQKTYLSEELQLGRYQDGIIIKDSFPYNPYPSQYLLPSFLFLFRI